VIARTEKLAKLMESRCWVMLNCLKALRSNLPALLPEKSCQSRGDHGMVSPG